MAASRARKSRDSPFHGVAPFHPWQGSRGSLSLDAPVAASKLRRERRPAPASVNPGPQCLRRRRGLAVRCQTGSTAAPFLRTEEPPAAAAGARNAQAGFTFVMKFGGSSLASAERMREVAGLILSFLDEMPVAVLSAMGKTTNNLLLGPSISSSQRLSQGTQSTSQSGRVAKAGERCRRQSSNNGGLCQCR
uniref:Aspartate/glutamate/uridylate kinase domain-containing protein n=1 Tax=Zea mays TaxID=4577 RepID=A0A804PA57_MAIZE